MAHSISDTVKNNTECLKEVAETVIVEDVEEMMEVAETVEVEEEDTPRTGPSPCPGTRGWRRSSSTLNTVLQGSTLKGKKSVKSTKLLKLTRLTVLQCQAKFSTRPTVLHCQASYTRL